MRMAREFARSFYKSKAWESTRNAYFESVHGLCERCKRMGITRPAHIVHHIEHLTPDNINDPTISLGFDNLEAVCRDCHAFYHPEIYAKEPIESRVDFDENGNVVRKKGK